MALAEMNKNELEYEKAKIAGENLRTTLHLFGRVATIVGTVWAISLVMEGLTNMVAGQSPDGIGALARVVEALNLGATMGYMWGGFATFAWGMERVGKKRIVHEKGKLQKQLESQDAYRPSSGLDRHGNDPGEEDE